MFTFDGPNKLIYIEDNSFEFNAQHLYSDWKRWLINDPQNATYSQAFRSIGGEAISLVKNIAPYIELLNGWRLKPWSGNYSLTVIGNLFATGGISPFVSADSGSILLSLETTGNALALETGTSSGSSNAAEIWEYQERTLTSGTGGTGSGLTEQDFARMQSQLDTLQAAVEFAINGNIVDVNDTKIMLHDAQQQVQYEGANLVFTRPE